MKNLNLFLLPTSIMLALVSCSPQKSRVHDKQRIPSDIKIDSLDVKKHEIRLRFEYRSYTPKTLLSIDCETSFANNKVIYKHHLKPDIKFESFATEILTFNIEDEKLFALIEGQEQIDYHIQCESTYDKGRENIQKSSILYQAPTSDFFYR